MPYCRKDGQVQKHESLDLPELNTLTVKVLVSRFQKQKSNREEISARMKKCMSLLGQGGLSKNEGLLVNP